MPTINLYYVDVGTNGRIRDSSVYTKSQLRKCLLDRSILNIPDGKNLPQTNINAPYVILADDVFSLIYNVMKPYPLKNTTKEEKIFNYRLSRGRKMVESCFGIWASRFSIFFFTNFLTISWIPISAMIGRMRLSHFSIA